MLGASAVSSQSCRACCNQDQTSPPDQFITMAVDRPAARPGRGTGFLLSALRFAGYDLDCRPTTPTSPINPTGAGTISAGGRYMHTLPAAAESARTLLEEYSSIRADDVDRHVYQMVRSNPRFLHAYISHLFGGMPLMYHHAFHRAGMSHISGSGKHKVKNCRHGAHRSCESCSAIGSGTCIRTPASGTSVSCPWNSPRTPTTK